MRAGLPIRNPVVFVAWCWLCDGCNAETEVRVYVDVGAVVSGDYLPSAWCRVEARVLCETCAPSPPAPERGEEAK